MKFFNPHPAARCAALLPLVFAMGTAHAVNSVATSSSFSNFHITVIDLDPNDGITAAINFNLPGAAVSYPYQKVGSDLALGATQSQPSKYSYYTQYSNQVTSLSGSTNVLGKALTSGTIVAGSGAYALEGASGTLQATVATATQGTGTSYQFEDYARLLNNASFTVTAHTQVIFSVDASVSVEASVNGDYQINGYSRALLSAGGNNDSIYVEGTAYLNHNTVDVEKTKTLSVSVINATNADYTGTASLTLSDHGYTQTLYTPPPVPEPETYAMLLAGLAIVGGIARRRQRQA